MKLYYTFISLLICSFVATAQEEPFPCSTDQVNSAIFHENPSLQQGIIRATQELKDFTQTYTSQAHNSRGSDPYIIPVVFHVIHDYGIGNIDDSQLYNAIELVNTQFRKRNADTTSIIEEFKHLAADTEIEFRLATLDPDGNCTNGITRTYSPLTNVGGHVVKDLIQWPPNQYVNVWVCSNVGPNLAGHCLMPGVADTLPEWDGIVIQHSYVGEIGTSSPSKKTVLTHELGHYMNLYHIWGGNNVPEFYYLPAADAGNCDHDDEVEDTPNTIGWQTCNLFGNSCGSLDMVQNYMDYSYCSLLFTEGQKVRMHAALNSTVANRNNLWSDDNLIAVGLKDHPETLCQTKIKASARVICAGESITFTDMSYHGVTAREWTFEGGDLNSSTDSSVVVTYNSPGKYAVSLSISDGSSTLQADSTDYIEVLDNQSDISYLIEGFENEPSFENNWYLTPSDNPLHFKRINYGKDSDYSLYIDNYNGAEKADYAIQTYPIDATSYTKLAVSLDFAFAKSSTSSNESIQIQMSKDCGHTWSTRKKIQLTSNFSIESDDEFFPSSSDWMNDVMETPIGTYNVENLLVRILFEGNKGNNVFIDNVNISDISLLSVDSEVWQNRLKVYPNPAADLLKIALTENQLDGTISLLNLQGQEVIHQQVNNQVVIEMEVGKLPRGTYLLKYTPKNNDMNYRVKKIVIL